MTYSRFVDFGTGTRSCVTVLCACARSLGSCLLIRGTPGCNKFDSIEQIIISNHGHGSARTVVDKFPLNCLPRISPCISIGR